MILWSSVGWFYGPDPMIYCIKCNVMHYTWALFDPWMKYCGMTLGWNIVGWPFDEKLCDELSRFNEIKK